MLFASKKDSTRYGVVFEIRSGSVAGAIVSSNPLTDSPVILYSTREFLPLKQTKVTGDITKRLLSVFLNIVLDIESKIPQYIPKKMQLAAVHINFTAPWSYTQGSTYTYESKEPIVITEKFLKEIQKVATEKKSNTAATTPDSKNNNCTIINKTTLGYTANNYPTANPVGQSAKCITATETISAVTNTIFGSVEDIASKLFTNIPTQFSTSPLIQQHLLSTYTKTPTTFATIHLTYEALELTFYRNNEILTALTTPIGINTIARNIAEHSSLPHEQILSFLTTDDISSFQEKNIKKIQSSFQSVLLDNLSDFFVSAHSSERLPHDFYLVTTLLPSPTITQMINQTLKKASNNRFELHTFPNPAVHTTQKGNIGANDTGICTLAYFFHNTVINN